ncbi:hypothetical protein Val02_05190 [Virgisporangium aliadipatigenens]|uniref:Uncharacterized protein n=1 Tax=Virgisporangium aliadipatigenens TaxID=741659 RepID=A0A8J4DNJ2_9ACTN|nr:hypothetical protein Val02_05190 [Virgisporangium aliadipatigenens]
MGQLVPPGPARVRVEQPESTVEGDADALGRFAVSGVRSGPGRLTMTPIDGGVTLRSQWTVF